MQNAQAKVQETERNLQLKAAAAIAKLFPKVQMPASVSHMLKDVDAASNRRNWQLAA